MMKIAQIICTYPPYKGGMGNSAYYLAQQLSLNGYDSVVFTPDYGGLEAKDMTPQNNLATTYLPPLFKYGNAAILPQLIWRLKGYDAIMFHYPFYGSMLPVLIAKIIRPKTKLFLYYHMDSLAGGLKGMIFCLSTRLVLPLFIKLSDRVFCSSLDYAEHSALAKWKNVWQSKFCELPFGFDSGSFAAPAEGGPNNQAELLFVGGLDKAHYFKGLPVLFQALALLKKTGSMTKPFKLTIVGSGDLRPAYEQEVAKLDLKDSVVFAGKVSDRELVAAYQRCDALVLPSINQGEAFGIVLVEAMAAGKPVVASNLPGVRSVFTDGREGFLVEPGNPDDLSEKIGRLLGNDELRATMGAAARKLAWERCAWEVIGKRLKLHLDEMDQL